MQKNTQCVHSGTYVDKATRGINTPVFTSSSFEYLDSPETVYPRYFNTPNQVAIVEKLCALEHAEDGLLFSSGMAAISTVLLSFLQSGDHVLLQKDIYGGTHHFVTAEFDKFNIQYSFAPNQAADIEKGIQPNTKIIYIETPSNPLLQITDMEGVAQVAKAHKTLTVIDNTFATPINQNPLDAGIDIAVHSGTKYFGGHSDICCGAVLASQKLVRTIRGSAPNFGGSLNALTCYLLERSLKTMGVRVAKQCRNAMKIARYLQESLAVESVYYPGLEGHPGFEIAKKQMRAFGAMLSFELQEQLSPDQFLRNLNLITPAVSLGGVESIICSPEATSHAKISAAQRAEMGISDNLLRLSVGIEDAEDLIADIEQACV